jgi:hypothetical protein
MSVRRFYTVSLRNVYGASRWLGLVAPATCSVCNDALARTASSRRPRVSVVIAPWKAQPPPSPPPPAAEPAAILVSAEPDKFSKKVTVFVNTNEVQDPSFAATGIDAASDSRLLLQRAADW